MALARVSADAGTSLPWFAQDRPAELAAEAACSVTSSTGGRDAEAPDRPGAARSEPGSSAMAATSCFHLA
jgi:hypothetical protein